MTQKTSSSFTICHIFALEINYFPVLLSVRALLPRSPKRNKRKVVSGSRLAVGFTLPENFAYKPELSFNPLAMVTLAVGSPYLLVNRALNTSFVTDQIVPMKLLTSYIRARLKFMSVMYEAVCVCHNNNCIQ